VNTPDVRPPRPQEAAPKRGPIGPPLPGTSIRIVDPETRQPLPVGTRGLLLVRGPTVMKGYLGEPQRTADVLEDGWYATGDIATQDDDGWLTITDRLSRFSRTGGEMVPHGEVEESLRELAQATETQVVVTGVPNGRGQRLAVLHTLSPKQVEASGSPGPACRVLGRRAQISSFTSPRCPTWRAASPTCAASAISPFNSPVGGKNKHSRRAPGRKLRAERPTRPSLTLCLSAKTGAAFRTRQRTIQAQISTARPFTVARAGCRA
jgi:hypothetical protein